MKGKKFWITEIILSFFSFCFFFAGLAGAFKCDGHVSTQKRDNVLSMLNPVSILLNNSTVLEDSDRNLYIGGLAGDDCTIQKFTEKE